MVGEHIRALKGGRWHHAIDCGDETVIHLADEGSRRSVRRSYRPEFISGAKVVEVVAHRQRTFPADEVVARAYSRIADPSLAAMFASSEAFAHWCATGRPSAPAEEADRAAPEPAPAAAPARRRSAPSRGEKGGRTKKAASRAGTKAAAPARRAKTARATPTARTGKTKRGGSGAAAGGRAKAAVGRRRGATKRR